MGNYKKLKKDFRKYQMRVDRDKTSKQVREECNSNPMISGTGKDTKRKVHKETRQEEIREGTSWKSQEEGSSLRKEIWNVLNSAGCYKGGIQNWPPQLSK